MSRCYHDAPEDQCIMCGLILRAERAEATVQALRAALKEYITAAEDYRIHSNGMRDDVSDEIRLIKARDTARAVLAEQTQNKS